MNRDLTLLLGIEARQNFSRVFDDLNSHLQQIKRHFTDVGEQANITSDILTKSLESPDIAAQVLDGQLATLRVAEAQLSDAAEKMAAAQQAAADGNVKSLAAQSEATKNYQKAVRELEKAQNEATAASIQFADVSKKAAVTSEEASAAVNGNKSALESYGPKAAVITTAIAGIAWETAKSALAFEHLTVQVANSANISTDAASKITSSFLQMSETSVFSADDMASAYGKVAGQLGEAAGHALSASEATKFMDAAAVSAAASGTGLSATVTSLAKVMQLYHLSANQASQASGYFYNASRLTGTGTSQLTMMITRMKSQLGVLAPSIKDTSALILDMAQHGQLGRMAIGSVTQMMNKLIQQGKASTPTLGEVNLAIAKLPVSLQKLAKGYEQGRVSGAAWTTELKNMAKTNPIGESYLKSLDALITKSKQSESTLNALKTTPVQNELAKLNISLFNSKGQFIGLGSVISQLGPKLRSMKSQQEQLRVTQLLFGQSSRKTLEMILAGKQGWDSATKAISDHKAMMAAAARTNSTYQAHIKELHHTIQALMITLGNAFLPIITRVMSIFIAIAKPVINFISKNKELVVVLLTVVGTISSLVTILWASHKVSGLMSDGFNMLKGDVGKLGRGIMSLGNSIISMVEKMGAMLFGTEAQSVAYVEEAAAADAAAVGIWATLAPILAVIAAIGVIIGVLYLLIKHWRGVWTVMKITAGWIYNEIIKPIVRFFELLWNDGVKQYLKLIELYFKMEWALVGLVVGFIWNYIIKPIAGFFEWLWKNGIKPAMDIIWAGIQMYWKVISTVAEWIYANIIQPIIGYWNDLLSFFEGLGATIAKIASTMWDGLYNAFVDVANAIIKAYDDTLGWIPGMHINTMHTIGTTVQQATATAQKGGMTNAAQNYLKQHHELATGKGSNAKNEQNIQTIVGLLQKSAAAGNKNDGMSGVTVHVHVNGTVYGSLNDMQNKLGKHLTDKVLPSAGVMVRR